MIALGAYPITFQVIVAFPDVDGAGPWGQDQTSGVQRSTGYNCAGFPAYLSRKQAEQPVLSCSEQQTQPRKGAGRGRKGRGLGKAVASGASAALSSPNPPPETTSPQPNPTPAGHVAVTSLSQRDS